MSLPELQNPSSPGHLLSDFPELSMVEYKLHEVLNRAEGIIKDACCSLLHSGGKRIRPLLTLYSGMCFGSLNTSTINAAVAAELIHMASLIHDDVIDDAATRRGFQTINNKHGNLIAILTGDYVFAEAFRILSSNQLLTSMNFLVQAIQAMCEGEVNQAGDKFATTATPEDYFKRIGKKTGTLLSSCCKSGAATAGASQQEIDLLGDYGLYLGYSYQIIDDILDFTGQSDFIGKPTCLDIMNGNITLPVIYLLESSEHETWLKELIETKKVTPDGITKLRDSLYKTGCLARSADTAYKCIQKAKHSLKDLPDNGYKIKLTELADRLAVRLK
ncbi:MAG: polyprenyl synthetase family protein [Desulfitobacterium hafniense]|nr:polyprenyl synthetase family protein [Desulfitobacterium hafniense]